MTILNHNLDHQHGNIALQVRQMRDLHIEALVRQYGGEEGKELADCLGFSNSGSANRRLRSWVLQ